MNRPKKENFTRKVFDGNFEAMYVFDSKSYEQALNDYIDQLEKQNDEITKAYYDVINTFGKELYKREKALNKACNDWEEETKDCYYLMIKNNLCDGKCGLCNKEKRIKLRKKWCMKDE